MAGSPQITTDADGHYRSTGELPPEKPFELPDDNTSGESRIIHEQTEGEFANDDKGGAKAPNTKASNDDAEGQAAHADSKGKATEHVEGQAADKTDENVTTEGGGEKSKNKKRRSKRKGKKSNATTPQDDEAPTPTSSPTWVQDVLSHEPTSSQKSALDTNTKTPSTTPIAPPKPLGPSHQVPTSGFEFLPSTQWANPFNIAPTSTDNIKAPLFGPPKTLSRNPGSSESIPAGSRLFQLPHGLSSNASSTSNDGAKTPIVPPESGSAVQHLPGAGPSTEPPSNDAANSSVVPPESDLIAKLTSLSTYQPPAETSLPPQVQQRPNIFLRRVQDRKANAGGAEPVNPNIWETEKAEQSSKREAEPQVAFEQPTEIGLEELQVRYLDLVKIRSKVDADNMKLSQDNVKLLQDNKRLSNENGNLVKQAEEQAKKGEDEEPAVDHLEQEVTRLEQELRDEHDKCEAHEANCKLSEAEVDKLKAQVQKQEGVIKDGEKRIKDGEKKIKDGEKKIKKLGDEVNAVKDKVQVQDLGIEQDGKTISELQSQIQELQTSLGKHPDYEEVIEAYREKEAQLQNESDDSDRIMKGKLKTAEGENKRLQSIIDEKVTQVNDQDTKIANLEKHSDNIDQLKADNKALKDENAQLNDAIAEHQDDIRQLKLDHQLEMGLLTGGLEKECTHNERTLRKLEEDIEKIARDQESLGLKYQSQVEKVHSTIEEITQANPGPPNTPPATTQAGNDLVDFIRDRSHYDSDDSDEEDGSLATNPFRTLSTDNLTDWGDDKPLSGLGRTDGGTSGPRSTVDGPPLSKQRLAQRLQRAMTSEKGTQTEAQATTTMDDEPSAVPSPPTLGMGPIITTIDIKPIDGAPQTPVGVAPPHSNRRLGALALVVLVVLALFVLLGTWGLSARRE
ncbi:MAG: hypothetical protein LQ352_001095, partial [Teloschistes flavicans]